MFRAFWRNALTKPPFWGDQPAGWSHIIWPENIWIFHTLDLISRPSTWHFQAFNGNSCLDFPHLDPLQKSWGKLGQQLGNPPTKDKHPTASETKRLKWDLFHISHLSGNFIQNGEKQTFLFFSASDPQEICLILWMAILMINSARADISIYACISLPALLRVLLVTHILHTVMHRYIYIYIYSFGLCGLLWLVLLGESWLHFLHCPVA